MSDLIALNYSASPENVTQNSSNISSSTTSSSDREEFIFECCVIVIGIIGTLANGAVITIFLSKVRRSKLSTSSEFILNQLSVDLFSCISLILVYGWKIANSTLGKSWNPVVCFLFGTETVLWAGVTSSIVNLIFITLERYLKIVHNPLHQKYYHKWMTHCLVVLAWISGSIIFPPNFVSFRSAGGVCIALYSWPNVYDGLLYSALLFIIQYTLPLLIFIFCYWRILVTVRNSTKFFVTHQNTQTRASNAHHHSQVALVKTMVIIVVMFGLCWSPNDILFVVMMVTPLEGLQSTAWYVTVLLGFMTFSLHPFIYGAGVDPVRRVIRNWFRKPTSNEPTASVASKDEEEQSVYCITRL